MSDPRVYGVGVIMDGATSLVDAREEALKQLGNSICVGVFSCPFLRNVRGGERFKRMMERVRRTCEESEV